ncbi:hypothetical protein CRYUN_Cryun11dG0005300 [Craigia yunnanensis]
MEAAWIEGKVLTLDEIEAGELHGRRLTLVCKIIADKPLSKGGVQGVFKRAWGEWRDFTVTELSENTYLFTFKEARAAEQILEDGPWSVMGYCICLQRWQPGFTPDELDFSQVVKISMTSAQLTEQAAESANQVSENVRNFLAAIKDKQLLAFEASDLEKMIDTFLSKVVNDFSTLLVSQGIQLGFFLKKLLKGDNGPVSKSDFVEATSEYIGKRTSLHATTDVSKDYICNGKNEVILNSVCRSPDRVEILVDLIRRQIKELKLFFRETRLEASQFHSYWEADIKRLENHVRDLEVASSSYLKILQENQMLFNEVLDLKEQIYTNIQPLISTQWNGLTVPDASWVSVSNTQDVLDLIRIGQKNRAVDPTAFNERSSHSHSVLTVHVNGKELVSGSIFKGSLNLVDLAGSERVDKSKLQGDRLKEAQYINRSLYALGEVISALAQKSGHAKTLMFIHVSPEHDDIGETISTLKFAERVASIEPGAARSNKETGDILELKEEITNLKLALEKKEAEVEQLRVGNTGSMTGSQKAKVLRFGISPNMKPETWQRPNDDTKRSEARTVSAAKQRRSKFSSALICKEISPKMPTVPEERPARSGKPKSPTPPVRRYLSSDKGASTKNKVKFDVVENQPMSKVMLPAKNMPLNLSPQSSSLEKVTQNMKKSSFL